MRIRRHALPEDLTVDGCLARTSWTVGRIGAILTMCAIAAVLGVGCHTDPEANQRRVDLRTEIESCPELDLWADLLDLEGKLHVHGTARAKGTRSTVQGHLEVVVRTADGTEWARDRTSYRIARRFRGGTAPAVFDLRFEGIPPPGSVVLLRHQEESGVAGTAENER